MGPNVILLALLCQVALTLALYVALIIEKGRATKAGLVDLARRALHDDAWPESVMKINNNIRNQFEVPVLFYVVTIVLWQLGEVGWLAQGLAWAFVASRVVHTIIHTGVNYVPLRRKVFTFGYLVLLAMAVLVVWRVLAG